MIGAEYLRKIRRMDAGAPDLDGLLRSMREPAAAVGPDLRVVQRNRAADSHSLLGAEDPLSGLSAAEREDVLAALRQGVSRIVPGAGGGTAAGAFLVMPAGTGALILALASPAPDHREGFAEEQLAALVATAVDGVICIDDRGRVELFNPACEKIFGYEQHEVLGENVKLLMPGKYAAHHDGYIEAYKDTGVKKIIGIGRDVEGRRKNGQVFPMKLSVGEFRHQDQRRFVGIVHDLSERAASERRLRDLQWQVAHMGRVSAVAEMGSALAHELNQPLTAMTLYLTSAERALAGDPEKTADLFRRAKTEAARAGDIIRRIRQMVERTDQEMAMFNLAAVLDASIDLCRMADAGRPCDFTISGVPAGFEVFGDQTQIQQILINLIKNALDATAGQTERRVHIFARIGGDLQLFVEDNGPGVTTGILTRLFTPFTSSKPTGLGIGLSICRNIADAHGGALDHVSGVEPARILNGACFRLTLPLETVNND